MACARTRAGSRAGEGCGWLLLVWLLLLLLESRLLTAVGWLLLGLVRLLAVARLLLLAIARRGRGWLMRLLLGSGVGRPLLRLRVEIIHGRLRGCIIRTTMAVRRWLAKGGRVLLLLLLPTISTLHAGALLLLLEPTLLLLELPWASAIPGLLLLHMPSLPSKMGGLLLLDDLRLHVHPIKREVRLVDLHLLHDLRADGVENAVLQPITLFITLRDEGEVAHSAG